MIHTLGIFAGATLLLFNQADSSALNNQVISPTTVQANNIKQSDIPPYIQFGSLYSDHLLDLTPKVVDAQVDKSDEISAPKLIVDKPVTTKVLVEPASIIASETKAELDATLLTNLVNSHRETLGLPILVEHEQLCQLAQERKHELYDEIFNGLGMHSGLRNRDLAYQVTENMIYNRTESGAFGWWLNSPIHRSAIESDRYSYTCTACKGNACLMLFSNFNPKR